MAPETLVFTTSHPALGGDEVLIQRASVMPEDALAYVQIVGGSAFLTLEEAIVMRDQLDSIIADAQ